MPRSIVESAETLTHPVRALVLRGLAARHRAGLCGQRHDAGRAVAGCDLDAGDPLTADRTAAIVVRVQLERDAHGDAVALVGRIAVGRDLSDGDVRRDRSTEIDRSDHRPLWERDLVAVDGALALPLDAPHEAGGILAGRWMDAWWAGPEERLPRVALKLSDRMAIRFSPMHLRDTHEKPLELLQRRLREFAGERVRQIPVELVAPISAPAVDPIAAPTEPVVLDSDLQVRERLRFLAWMRRVQAEHHREPAEPSHRS